MKTSPKIHPLIGMMRIFPIALLMLGLPLLRVGAEEQEFKADEHTLLLCHFENDLRADQAKGMPDATVTGPVQVAPGGKFGKGAQIQKDGWLRYKTNDGNLDVKEGTIEFWLKPDWNAYEGKIERLINLVSTVPVVHNFSIYVLDEGKLVGQMVWYDKDGKVASQTAMEYKINDPDGFKDHWHHVVLMWKRDSADSNKGSFWFRLDGKAVGGARGAMLFKDPPPYLDLLSLHVSPASTGMVDELRISDIRRYKDGE